MPDSLLGARPVRRPELVLGPAVLRGPRELHVVKDPTSRRSYEIGAREHFIIERLDGTRTLADIGGEYAARFGRRLGESSWSQLLGLLAKRRMLVGTEPDPSDHRRDEPAARARVLGTLRFGNPSALLTRLHRRAGFLLVPAVLVPVLIAVLAMEALLALRIPDLTHQSAVLATHPELGMLVVGLLWLSNVLHELAHGLVCRHYGGDASEIGMRWGFLFYCKVTDVLLFPSRWQRVATAGVGVVANLAFLLPFTVLWLLLPANDVTRHGIAALLLVGSVQALLNLIPVPNLDGYVIVGHLLNTTGLCAEARRYLGLLVRRSTDRIAEYPRRLRIGYLAYPVGAVLLVAALVVGAVVLVGRWQSTLAGQIALSALVVAAGGLAAARCLDIGSGTRRRTSDQAAQSAQQR